MGKAKVRRALGKATTKGEGESEQSLFLLVTSKTYSGFAALASEAYMPNFAETFGKTERLPTAAEEKGG